MPLPKLMEAINTLHALEAAAADGDPKAGHFVAWFVAWIRRRVVH